MTLRLNGSSSGYTEIDAPAVAGSNTLVLPGGNGTNGQFLQTNGSGTLSWSGSLTLGTAQNSTSGTNIDFTGIPSWAKRVTVMFNGVSTTGINHFLLQIGSGSFATSGYVSGASGGQTGLASTSSTSGFVLTGSAPTAANSFSGHALITLFGSNAWVLSGTLNENVGRFASSAGNVTLSGTLDRIRITTVGGTDTFDAGSINIMYEG